jgi:hypothetical protein
MARRLDGLTPTTTSRMSKLLTRRHPLLAAIIIIVLVTRTMYSPQHTSPLGAPTLALTPSCSLMAADLADPDALSYPLDASLHTKNLPV